MKILVMGLPESGKTHLAFRLSKQLNCAWFNADEIRRMANDWDFSDKGRSRQASRMRSLADFEVSNGGMVICDFVCPTNEYRDLFSADIVIFMNTINNCKYHDTNSIFVPPVNADYEITEMMSDSDIEKLGDDIWKKA